MRSRIAITFAASLGLASLTLATGTASATPSHKDAAASVRLSVARSIPLSRAKVGSDFFITSPVVGRHQLYTFGLTNHDGYAPALIDTSSGKVTGLGTLGYNGFFEPGARLVYAFNGGPSAPAAAHGIQIIRGTKTIASSPLDGINGMPLRPGEAAVVGTTDLSYPISAATLLRYRGSKLLSQTPICADVWTMAYLPKGDLIYAVCRQSNGNAAGAMVEVFRGAHLVSTITDFANVHWVVTDAAHNLAYLQSSHSIRVYHGTDLLATVHTASHVGDFIPTVDDVTGDVYYNGFDPGVTLVVNRSGLVATRHFPGHRTAVNERNGLAYFGHKGPNGWEIRVVRGSKLVGKLTMPHVKLRRYDPVSGDVIVTTPRTVMLLDGTQVVARHHVPGTDEITHVSNVNSNPSTRELYVIAKARGLNDDQVLVVFREAS